jgi:DNA polymerase-3 subunit epsilon/CBS domain-containing protein
MPSVLGSGGRGESLLAMDQDNALFFAEGEPGGAEDRWFEALGAHIADILHEVGLPYCKGGVMAKNAPWRGSAKTWRDRIAGWIRRSKPEDLLSHLDMRASMATSACQTLGARASIARPGAARAGLLVETAGAAPALNRFGAGRSTGASIARNPACSALSRRARVDLSPCGGTRRPRGLPVSRRYRGEADLDARSTPRRRSST